MRLDPGDPDAPKKRIGSLAPTAPARRGFGRWPGGGGGRSGSIIFLRGGEPRFAPARKEYV